MCKISIVTVTYNVEKVIEKTLKSILNQRSKKYEYIIIDGKSKDSTINILENYKKKFEQKKIKIKIISEEDSGIYNAMNKSLRFVSGEWIYFLNAGDTLYDDYVIEKLTKQINEISGNIGVVYGNVCEFILDNNHIYKKITSPKPLYEIKKRMIFCHQGCIVKTDILKKYKFNEKYRLTADYDFFRKIYLKKIKFKEVTLIFSNYELLGVSSNYEKVHLEYLKISLSNPKSYEGVFYNLKFYFIAKVKNILKVFVCNQRIINRKIKKIEGEYK